MDENFVTEDVIDIPEGLELFGEDDCEETEPVETPEETEDEVPEDPEPNQEETQNEEPLYELKVNGQIHKVPQSELIKLGQMGMDYERVKQQRDQYMNAPEIKILDDMARRFGMTDRTEFLQSFDHQIKEQRIQDRASELISQRGIDQETAIYLARLEQQQEDSKYQNELQQQQMQHKQHQQTAEQRAQQERQQQLVGQWSALYEAFPELKEQYEDFTKFPDAVKEMITQGRTPLEAYSKHLLDERNNELQILKNNNKVKEKSTGSLKASGKDGADPFLAGWNSED